MPLYELRKLFHGAGEFFGTTLAPARGGRLPGAAAVDREARCDRGSCARWSWRSSREPSPSAPSRRGKDAHDAVYRQAARQRRSARGGRGEARDARACRRRARSRCCGPTPSCAGATSSTQHCASCHVLGDLGDPEKATAAKLDGWGTAKWIEAHDPRSRRAGVLRARALQGQDAERRRAARRTRRTIRSGSPWSRATRTATRWRAFLASLGDEPGDRAGGPRRRDARDGREDRERAPARPATSTRATATSRAPRMAPELAQLRVAGVDAGAGGKPRDGRHVPEEGARTRA